MLTQQDQLILVCEKLLGWRRCETSGSECWIAPDGNHTTNGRTTLPPLTLDLTWECEEKLSKEEFTYKDGFIWSQRCEYMSQLERIVVKESDHIQCNFEFYHASKEQRLAALVETIKDL